jgi:hypothetical protein
MSAAFANVRSTDPETPDASIDFNAVDTAVISNEPSPVAVSALDPKFVPSTTFTPDTVRSVVSTEANVMPTAAVSSTAVVDASSAVPKSVMESV